ncbi:uncharacterized protein LAESUDRAFT_724354 [Laetiporus sulphureus 93-53]|uniref:Zn(2)-C6 fungal-type domain-containing protein n=1 Tax=Laetiporus sulphureus 93-53 TaxID=1314785 RepID=A0A165EW25_9APHY|nr:uncharacterized protein LAESUDRAFT_724354 [Laetiporus sulphureus 93-53]KZT07889.1 hypothetical protein LAESUDRAFT_724354 [Laetiporus sulphureus 93-53]
MSSQEDEPYDGESSSQHVKKRRIQRACDSCRRKKIRCDGTRLPSNKCSNCATFNYDCTFVETAKKRGPSKEYVEGLENRLDHMEKLLRKFCPDLDLSKELDGRPDNASCFTDRGADSTGRSTAARGAQVVTQAVVPPPPDAISNSTEPDELEPSDDETVAHRTLIESFSRMRMDPTAPWYFGKSSNLMFLRNAVDLKREYSGNGKEERPDTTYANTGLPYTRWSDSYNIYPWLSDPLKDQLKPQKPLLFPDKSTMFKLIDIYFSNVNIYLPLLHRPTFEASIKEGLHLRHEAFGSTVLLVCAIAARTSDDSQVPGSEPEKSPFPRGWEWFRQVRIIRKSVLAPPQLYDMQIYCLTAFYLQGTSAGHTCRTIIGIGILAAQDLGAHRKKVYSPKPTAEEELWKRAFWVLVVMDRAMSSALGRPCIIQDEDYDVDLPIECDDEYWTNSNPEIAFTQPSGKPSTVAFFNCLITLNRILWFTLRTIYSINKSKALLGFVGKQWEQQIVAELDSALNKWVDSVPDHLRWDPNREDITFLNQSATLYGAYYTIQIFVHRPFIPSPRKPSPLSFPSLAICTNAARSCIHVLDIQFKRSSQLLYLNTMCLFTSGVVLLQNIWAGKRLGLTIDPNKEMAEVHKCMKMLKSIELQSFLAGRLLEVLRELASFGDLPLPAMPQSHKRERDSEGSSNVTDDPMPSNSSATNSTTRNIAGSKRASRDVTPVTASTAGRQSMPPQVMTNPDEPSNGVDQTNMFTFSLPIHSDELGRLPLHPCFSIDTKVPSSIGSSWYGTAPPGTSNFASPISSVPQARPSMAPVGTNGLNGGLDPAIVPMFTASDSDVYDSIFGIMPDSYPAPRAQDFRAPLQSAQDPGLSLPDDIQRMGPESFFMDNSLAMWSAAPSGFEWDDWDTYISGFNALNSPTGSSQPPRG